MTISREQAAGRPERAELVSRGWLRIYLGFAPGACATCAMVSEAQRRAEQGTDVVVASAVVHGQPRTTRAAGGPGGHAARQVPFQGTMAEELDLDPVPARRPAVARLDELAHGNVPGARHATRWKDAEKLPQAGIDVVATV